MDKIPRVLFDARALKFDIQFLKIPFLSSHHVICLRQHLLMQIKEKIL